MTKKWHCISKVKNFLYMENSNNKRTPMIIAGVVIALLIIGAVVYAIMNNQNQEEQASNNKQSSSVEVTFVGEEAMYANKDIIENITQAPNLSTLVTAVQAAGLVDTLKGEGPFTVFGPTNFAFAKIPQEVFSDLLKPENVDDLKSLLTYHVVSGKYKVEDLKDGQELTTVNGALLRVTKMGSEVLINNARIETSNVMQKNGVAHVIDTVLIPSEAGAVYVGGVAMYPDKTFVENLVNAPNLTTVASAVQMAGLIDALSTEGPITVFGPTNEAFNKLPANTLQPLLDNPDKSQLIGILSYHVVEGRYLLSDLRDGQELTTITGQKLTVRKQGNRVSIIGGSPNNVAVIETADVVQKNGVAHIIDTVLQP